MTECDKCDTKLGFFTENTGSDKCEECEKGAVYVNTVVETKSKQTKEVEASVNTVVETKSETVQKVKLYEIGNAGKPNGGLLTWTGWDTAPSGASYLKV